MSSRALSYLIFGAGLVVIELLDLMPALLAGLASYMALDLTERGLIAAGARKSISRAAAVTVFLLLAGGIGWTFGAFAGVGVARLPELIDTVLPKLSALAETWGYNFPVENARELRDLVVTTAKANVQQLGKTSGIVTRDFAHVLVGVFVAILRFLSPSSATRPPTNLFESLMVAVEERAHRFVRSFERVVGAQVMISTVNTIVTAVFLYAMDFPFRNFLILTTFVCGLIPILGNLISNTVIVAAGLINSVQLAVIGLVFLVVVHKLEYVLNSRIVGGSINTPMWVTLLGLLAGEALMGVPGVLIAPAMLHYLRDELRDLPPR